MNYELRALELNTLGFPSNLFFSITMSEFNRNYVILFRKVKVSNFVNREDRFIYNVVGTIKGSVEPGSYYSQLYFIIIY